MNSTPKVSIIIPAYNTGNFLKECLDSVVNQTYGNIEVIVINDGSTDLTLSIARSYRQADSRVIVIDQTNHGISYSRNAGIARATGDYLQFVDSDDILELNTVETLINTVQSLQAPVDFISFDAEPFFETEELAKRESKYAVRYITTKDYSDIKSGVQMLSEMRRNGEYRCEVWLMLINRKWLESHSITFRNGILHEDDLFTFICCMNADRVAHIPFNAYKRRLRENSVMTRKTSFKNVKGAFIAYINMLDELSKHDIDYKQYPEINLVVSDTYYASLKYYKKIKSELPEHYDNSIDEFISRKHRETVYNDFSSKPALNLLLMCIKEWELNGFGYMIKKITGKLFSKK